MPKTQRVVNPSDLAPAGVLSNDSYRVLINEHGAGYSWFRGQLLSSNTGRGVRLHVQEPETGDSWWIGPGQFSDHRAEVGPGSFQTWVTVGALQVRTDVSVDPTTPTELRRYVLRNRSAQRRRFVLTVVTELASEDFVPERAAVGAPSRPRSTGDGDAPERVERDGRFDVELDSERRAIAAHRKVAGASVYWVPAFVSADAPATPLDAPALSATNLEPEAQEDQSSRVQPPKMGLQIEVAVDPEKDCEVVLAATAGATKDEVRQTLQSLEDAGVRADAFLKASLREQEIRDRLRIGPRNADRYHRLAAAVLQDYDVPTIEPAVSSRKRLGLDPSQPVVMCRIASEDEVPIAKLVLRARDFWRAMGVPVQVMIINDKSGSHAEELQRALRAAINSSDGGSPETVLHHADRVAVDDQRSVQDTAFLVVTGDNPHLLKVDA